MPIKTKTLECNVRPLDDEVMDRIPQFYEAAGEDPKQAFADALAVTVHFALFLDLPADAVASALVMAMPVIRAMQDAHPEIFANDDDAAAASVH